MMSIQDLSNDLIKLILTFADSPQNTGLVCKKWDQLSDSIYENYLTKLKTEKNSKLYDDALTRLNKSATHKRTWLYLKNWALESKKNYALINHCYSEQGTSENQKINFLIIQLLNPTEISEVSSRDCEGSIS